jgi:hypothetical protein
VGGARILAGNTDVRTGGPDDDFSTAKSHGCGCLAGGEPGFGVVSPAAASPRSSGDPAAGTGLTTVTKVVGLDNSGLESLRTIRFAPAKAGKAAQRALDTPPASCDISGTNDNPAVTLTVQSNYIFGELVSTSSTMNGWVICDQSAPDQTMAYMSDAIDVNVNLGKRATGSLGQCQHSSPTDPPCLGTGSYGTYLCVGETNCAGRYQAINYPTLMLPDGYIWTAWPANCEAMGGGRELYCYVGTGVLTVSPTD